MIILPNFEQASEAKQYSAGEKIFSRGESGACMYYILSGSVDITAEGRVVDQIKEGSLFGEMALIDKQARSADAVARTDATIVPIDERQFLYTTKSNPEFALQVLRLIVFRLRQRMADLEEVRTYLGLLQG